MVELNLSPGPHLIHRIWTYDEAAESGEWVTSDVTVKAHEFLFDDVEIDEGFTLSDLFGLLEASPELQKVMRRNYCEELMEEARKGVSPDFKAGYDPDEIEYLELCQMWHKNTLTQEFQPTHKLSFHGVGYELREPRNEPHGLSYPVGHRIEWGVSSAPLRELLPLPIRLKTKVLVCEDDIDARGYGEEIEVVSVASASLGQILRGVLWELSFYGGPAGQEKVISEIKESLAGIADGTAELTPFDDLDAFKDLDKPGIKAMFNSIGPRTSREVSRALRELEDDEPVATGLAKTFSDDVVVKSEYSALGARPFRRLFREAKKLFREAK